MNSKNRHLRPDRPLDVTVLSIWDGIALGVIPALTGGLTLASTSSEGNISLLTLCLGIGIPIAIVSAAVGTFRGNDRARLGLLLLLAIYFTLIIFQNVTLLIVGSLNPEERVRSIGGILVSIISLVINLWYFLRASTIAYFRRPIHP
jgi:hypothetical protein